MKVAIIHYWWISNRGGEAVVDALMDIYPDADLFLHVSDDELVRQTLGLKFTGNIYKTFISKLPNAKKYYQSYLPLMPLALEGLDLSEYDLIISSESGPAKGVITRPDSVHICYCHSPMRYLWDMHHQYLKNAGFIVRFLFPLIAHWLRVWDLASASRVDFFIANSTYVAKRINKYYRRESQVIYPPVKVSHFSHLQKRGDFYLYLGQLTGYKRVDLAIEAFNLLKLPLIVIGEGEDINLLKKIANPNIKFLGRQPFDIVKRYLETCKALIFPGLEDFGIVFVEAMAAGAPVVAYGKGGVLDIVTHGITGVLFNNQKVDELIEAVKKIEEKQINFDVNLLHSHALEFDISNFKTKIMKKINNIIKNNTP
jgi:glycosyltransferase involved in cell wall biosynthesis